jgi:hypothetical protein
MKRKRFTEEQIAFALRQAEAGAPVEEVCRKLGISEPRSDAAGHGTTSDPVRRGRPIGCRVRAPGLQGAAAAGGVARWMIGRARVVLKHGRHQPSSGLRAG